MGVGRLSGVSAAEMGKFPIKERKEVVICTFSPETVPSQRILSQNNNVIWRAEKPSPTVQG